MNPEFENWNKQERNTWISIRETPQNALPVKWAIPEEGLKVAPFRLCGRWWEPLLHPPGGGWSSPSLGCVPLLGVGSPSWGWVHPPPPLVWMGALSPPAGGFPIQILLVCPSPFLRGGCPFSPSWGVPPSWGVGVDAPYPSSIYPEYEGSNWMRVGCTDSTD